MQRRGFTIVEIIITITIMGILLTLTVVTLGNNQMRARDEERKADIESIALNLESYYRNAQDGVFMSGGSYPGTAYLTNADTTYYLPDIDPKSLRAPGVDTTQPISIVVATNANQTTSGVLPAPTAETYVYQALAKDNLLCEDPLIAGGCRKFNLYYMLEADGSIQMVTSKNQ